MTTALATVLYKFWFKVYVMTLKNPENRDWKTNYNIENNEKVNNNKTFLNQILL